MQWAIGDWYNAIPWGDKEAACEKAGLNYLTAQGYGYVAAKYQIQSRNQILGFKHHKVVAPLSTDQRAKLLMNASALGWSSARLAKERDKLLGKPEKVASLGRKIHGPAVPFSPCRELL